MVTSTKNKEKRKRKEEKFLDLCKEGDLKTIKILLAEDPSLINCKNFLGKFRIKC